MKVSIDEKGRKQVDRFLNKIKNKKKKGTQLKKTDEVEDD